MYLPLCTEKIWNKACAFMSFFFILQHKSIQTRMRGDDTVCRYICQMKFTALVWCYRNCAMNLGRSHNRIPHITNAFKKLIWKIVDNPFYVLPWQPMLSSITTVWSSSSFSQEIHSRDIRHSISVFFSLYLHVFYNFAIFFSIH